MGLIEPVADGGVSAGFDEVVGFFVASDPSEDLVGDEGEFVFFYPVGPIEVGVG